MNTCENIITLGGSAMSKSAMMPPYGQTLTQEEIHDVIAYTRAIAQPPLSAPGASGVEVQRKVGCDADSTECDTSAVVVARRSMLLRRSRTAHGAGQSSRNSESTVESGRNGLLPSDYWRSIARSTG